MSFRGQNHPQLNHGSIPNLIPNCFPISQLTLTPTPPIHIAHVTPPNHPPPPCHSTPPQNPPHTHHISALVPSPPVASRAWRSFHLDPGRRAEKQLEEWGGERKVSFLWFSSRSRRGREVVKDSQREWRVPGALTGVENLGSHLGGPYQLTAKFVHSAVEGFGLHGVPGSCVLIIYRSEMSQDSDKVGEFHSKAPGRVGRGKQRQ